jgi:hypothetical protein
MQRVAQLRSGPRNSDAAERHLIERERVCEKHDVL